SDSRVNQHTSTVTTPGKSETSCSGSAATIGIFTDERMNCQTTSTPAETRQVTTTDSIDVRNIVEGNGMRYTIRCTANWAGSNCSPLIEGDQFAAEIEGKTMWIVARKGGNQGKAVRIKYEILDIRAVDELSSTKSAAANPADTASSTNSNKT